MNFCSQCGCHLHPSNLATGKCDFGHTLPSAAVQPPAVHQVNQPVAVRQATAVGPVKPERKLPTTPEEREEAYVSALGKLTRFFEGAGFTAYVSEGGTLMVGKGRFLLDAKIVDNDGRTAYVTSGAGYNPAKAGTKDSRATIITSRSVLKTQRLLRVTVSANQTVPIFVELGREIPDPEAHVCRSVLFILQQATTQGSSMNTSLMDRSFMKDVPAEWLPKAGEHDHMFGLPGSGSVQIPQFPK